MSGARGLLAVAMGLALLAVSAPAAPGAPPVYKPPPGNSAGWVPPNDPESLSVVTGRRDAPLVSMPFSGGARSLPSLGRAVLRALASGDADSMLALCVSKPEFDVILWPEFPESRPATGLTAMDGWRTLGNRLTSGSRGALSEFGSQAYEFVAVETSGAITKYRNFKLHRGFVVVAKDAAGETRRFEFVRSVAERKGVFKIYSMRD